LHFEQLLNFDSCESLSKHHFEGGLHFEQLLNFD
jgi:hypothetical protein